MSRLVGILFFLQCARPWFIWDEHNTKYCWMLCIFFVLLTFQMQTFQSPFLFLSIFHIHWECGEETPSNRFVYTHTKNERTAKRSSKHFHLLRQRLLLSFICWIEKCPASAFEHHHPEAWIYKEKKIYRFTCHSCSLKLGHWSLLVLSVR